MRTIVAAAVLNILVAMGFIIISIPAQASIPCEDMLQKMLAARSSLQLAEVDARRVNDLEVKAVERCNADDDARSDRLLAQAIQIMGQESTSAP
jgi:hypothetical protein